MKNLLSRTKSGRRKGSLGLVLDSDAAEQAASTNGAAAAPAPADAVDDAPAGPAPVGPPPSPGGLVDQTEEELRNLREALFTVKTALVEMRTRSSLVSDSCDSDDARAPL